MRLRCDVCGTAAPDVVGPILIGLMGWAELSLDGEVNGVQWEGEALLCPEHAERVQHGYNVSAPPIRTFRGGLRSDPSWFPERVTPWEPMHS